MEHSKDVNRLTAYEKELYASGRWLDRPVKRLTKREVAVLQGRADGLSSKDVALALGISENTVLRHLDSCRYKMERKTLPSTVAEAMRKGYVT